MIKSKCLRTLMLAMFSITLSLTALSSQAAGDVLRSLSFVNRTSDTSVTFILSNQQHQVLYKIHLAPHRKRLADHTTLAKLQNQFVLVTMNDDDCGTLALQGAGQIEATRLYPTAPLICLTRVVP